ncbi:MAG: exonuclease SbcCD subunit D [Euryarchaeota archaeon]|nr:exonuclease SbcCD subunit D [Euryarchaeota archaeon]
MPRLLHVSDTHLGHQAYARLTSDGLNQREVDFNDAFRRVVDHAVATRPDLVVHSGDLFDVVRPSNRAIAFALEQVRRLQRAEVPFVVVSGNHEAPRMRETGSIFRIFDDLPGVHASYRGEYEAIPVATRAGRVTVHAVPQALEQSEFNTQLARAEPHGNGPHVLAAHGTVSGVDGLFVGELNELLIPHNALRDEYDYIALGHFHNHRVLGRNAAYAGSTERTSFSEALEEKGFLDVDIGSGAPNVRVRATNARPMRDAGVYDARGRPANEIVEEASQRLEAVAQEGAIVRLRVVGLDPATVRALDANAIRRAAGPALHLDLRLETHEADAAQQSLPELGSLDAEFQAFLAGRPLAGLDRERVAAVALSYLQGAEGSRAA